MIIMAIDLGKFKSMVCFYNTETQEHLLETVATQRDYFHALFKTYLPDLVRCGGLRS